MILKKILQFSLIFVINIMHNSCKSGVNINRFVHSVRFPFILRWKVPDQMNGSSWCIQHDVTPRNPLEGKKNTVKTT